MSALGSNIKFLRERHNISALAMSKKLRISLQDYNAWESGLSLPAITNVMDICAVYGLKNPTDLFSDNFVQIYNSSEIKSMKQVAKRKAEERKQKEESDDIRLNFIIKDGSYKGSTPTFDITIVLAISILVSLFFPAFIVKEKVLIGYLAISAGIYQGIFVYLLAILAFVVVVMGIRGNYKILEGNEFMTKSYAIGMKVFYLLAGLVVGTFALLVYFSLEDYEYGLTLCTALSLVFMMFSIMSSLSIKSVKKDAMTYTYVIKFSKFKLKSDKPRKILKTISIIGLVLLVIAVALGVVQLIFGKALLIDMVGLNKGFFAKVTTGFYDMLPYITKGIFNKIVCGLVVALVLFVRISNIVLTRKAKKTDYNDYVPAEQTRSLRKRLGINIALDVASYAMAYALIIGSLTATVEGSKLIYQYYLLPILTFFSLIAALRYLACYKVYSSFRGAETEEVTGFSEVKLDEEKRQKKLDKKGDKPEKSEKPPKEPKPKKEKKGKGEGTPETPQEGGNN